MFQDQTEWELAGDWPRCPDTSEGPLPCGATARAARVFTAHRNIGFYCGNGHRLVWAHKGQWIPHSVFLDGGEYPNLLPDYLLTHRQRRRRDNEFGIGDTARYRVSTATECEACGRPPFLAFDDAKALYKWIERHNGDLFDRIVAELRHASQPLKYSQWLSRVSVDLRFEVTHAIRNSRLVADHGIPVAVLKLIWPAMSAALRNFARNEFVFALCDQCNRGRGGRLAEPKEALLGRHLRVRLDGNRVAAAFDPRWNRAVELCTLAYAEVAEGL